MASTKVQFINISSNDPEDTSISTKRQRKLAHSHAARSAHATARRLRTREYQSQKRSTKQINPDLPTDHSQARLNNFLSASRTDPFMSYATPLKPMEEMLLDHYVTAVIPLMRCEEPNLEFADRMTKIWVPYARADASLLNIIFLLSSRHLSAMHTQPNQRATFTRGTFHYKGLCVQTLRAAISTEAPSFSESTIAKAIMLAYDELFVHDKVLLKYHLEAALQMVALKGGPQALGLNGLLTHLLFKLVSKGQNDVNLQVEVPWRLVSDRNDHGSLR